MREKLLLFGAGGHCRSVIDSINKEQFSDIKIVDKNDEADAILLYKNGYKQAFIAIGSIGNPNKRNNLYNKLKDVGFCFPVIIDSTAIISTSNVNIEEGTFVGKGVIINSGVSIGKFAIINTGAIIDHDCEIGQFVHIAPGVTISGGVTINDNTHIGTGSSVIQEISIGENTIIGAGSVVVSDIENNVTAFGVPCKVKNNE